MQVYGNLTSEIHKHSFNYLSLPGHGVNKDPVDRRSAWSSIRSLNKDTPMLLIDKNKSKNDPYIVTCIFR